MGASPQIPLDTHRSCFKWRPRRDKGFCPGRSVLQDKWIGHGVRMDGGENLMLGDPVSSSGKRDELEAETADCLGAGV